MNKNIFEFIKIEEIFFGYFKHRNICLVLALLVLLIVCRFLMEEIHKHGKDIDYKKILGTNVKTLSLIVIIGLAVHAAGIEFEFAVDYVPILLFASALVIVLIIQGIECIRFYRNYEAVMKQTIGLLIHIIELETLLLVLMGHLQVIELFCALGAVITLEIADCYVEKLLDLKYVTSDFREIEKDDFPVEKETDIFTSRKRQIDNLCRELNKHLGDPFAVVISGEWGSGKTSLVNILKMRMNQHEFVNVECGVESDVKGILDDIALQFSNIYKKNNIYIGRNNSIEKYFKRIGELVNVTGYNTIAEIINTVGVKEKGSFLECKDEINEELSVFYALTKKRIYIVVDNMDRIIDDKDRAVLFQVIRESVGLNNCITLFMVDYNKLTSDPLSKEFLEKYVNHHVDLCEVPFEEMMKKYMEYYLTDDFWKDMSAYISERGKEFKKKLIENGANILTMLLNDIDEIQEILKKKDVAEDDKKKYGIRLNCYKDAAVRLRNRTRNPRKVKRFLSSIEKMITIADIVWFQNEDFDNNEYSKENWIETIFQISFLKIFLYEEYNAMLIARDLQAFKEEKESLIVEYILDGFAQYYFKDENKEAIISLVVYRLYALDIDTDKSKHQRLLEEIDSGELRENNLMDYVKECFGLNFNYQRMIKVLDYLVQIVS